MLVEDLGIGVGVVFLLDRTILSIPRGPSEVRMASPTAIRVCQDRVLYMCDMARQEKKVDICDIYPWQQECC